MKDEKGFVLISALVFLVILTILGTAILSETVLEEKMSSATQQKMIAMYAAESALTVCENTVQGWAAHPTFDPTNGTDGLHLTSTTSMEIGSPWNPNWDTTDIILYDSVNTALSGVADQPACIIEHLRTVTELPPGLPPVIKQLYRISAEGFGQDATAVDYAQSIMTRQF
jgi:type IV pilus assembly protein PilX